MTYAHWCVHVISEVYIYIYHATICDLYLYPIIEFSAMTSFQIISLHSFMDILSPDSF